MKAGDRIVEVDGRTIHGISADVAADMLKGDVGTAINLVVLDPRGATPGESESFDES